MTVYAREAVEMVSASDVPADGRPIALAKVRFARGVRAWETDAVESAPVEFTIHPRALTMQLVKLPTGELAHASANVVVYTKEGKVVHEDMAKLKLSLFDVERKDIPAAPPEVAFEQDELSGKVSDIGLVHFSDEPALPKGERRLRVTWKLALKGDAIESRLRAPLEAATSALENATRAAEAASSDENAEAAAVAGAKAELAKAKAAQTAAEAKYKTDLAGERGRLAKRISCGDVRLATNKGIRAPTNAKGASDACKALDKDNEVEVTLFYPLERYELPIALVYSIGKTDAFSAIASEPLIKLDPR